MGWQPIEAMPVFPFDKGQWYLDGPRYLLWTGGYIVIGSYGYTKTGKGRWRTWTGTINPTHWMPLPPPP